MVADVAGVVGVQKLERAVVDGQAQNAHVVGVHHAVAKAHGLPLRHHGRGALAHGLQKRSVGVAGKAGCGTAGGVKPVNDVVGQRFQLLMLVVIREVLKMTKAHKAGGGPSHHGGSFNGFAVHILV